MVHLTLRNHSWGKATCQKRAVLIHGITSNGRSWLRVASELVNYGYFCIAPDLLAHGESPTPIDGYSIDEILESLYYALPKEPDLLVGHSLGGLFAYLLLSRGYLYAKYTILEDPTLYIPSKKFALDILNDLETTPKTEDYFRKTYPKWDQQDISERVKSLDNIRWDLMRKIFVDNAPWDYRNQINELVEKTSVLFILPEKSIWVSKNDITRFTEILGGQSVVTMHDVGHAIHRDDLAGFTRVILSWIT